MIAPTPITPLSIPKSRISPSPSPSLSSSPSSTSSISPPPSLTPTQSHHASSTSLLKPVVTPKLLPNSRYSTKTPISRTPTLSDLIMDEESRSIELPIPPGYVNHSRSQSQSSQPSLQSSLLSSSPILNANKRSSWYGQPSLDSLQIPSISLSSSPSSDSTKLSMGPPLPMAPPPRSVSPMKSLSPPKQPFNFTSTTLSPAKANQRRGHRYKHSSVSMNFFQEPPPRAPLAIPASLPIPNFTEWRQSMSKEQKIRLCWTICHISAALLVYNCDAPFTALAALSHLLLYDAMGAILCVAVDVLSNFDVWKQSSIHLPFGLERIEVLAGFALSVSLIFMGGDIISHVIQEFVQSIYAPGQHGHSHGKAIHSHINGLTLEDSHEESLHWASIVFRVTLGIVATTVSAIGLNNHSRISRTMNRERAVKSTITSNPTHLLTITFSISILLFPLLGSSGYVIVDALLTPIIAGSMCYIGWLHSKSLAGMLVMSYSGHDRIEDIDEQIRQDPLVHSVSDISLWQVHHELWLASMKIIISGTDEDERRIREKASTIVKTTMGDDELSRWETTIDITRTTLE